MKTELDKLYNNIRRKAAMIVSIQETDKYNSAVKPVNDILDKIDMIQGKRPNNQEWLDWRETFIAARQSIRNQRRLSRQMGSN